MSTRRKKPLEAVSGSYTAIPHRVLDSKAFMGASNRAKAMLFELCRQHNGRNNGHFQLSVGWLRKRGWKSNDQIQKAKTELLDRGLVIKTRLGGLSAGPDWFALTWAPICNYDGLDISSSDYHPGKWCFMDKLPIIRKQGARTVTRDSTVPLNGIEQAQSVPPQGTKKTIFSHSPVPPHGNNEYCQLPTSRSKSRVVGKKGRSGIKTPSKSTIIGTTYEDTRELVKERDAHD